jgi:hypothetical protein
VDFRLTIRIAAKEKCDNTEAYSGEQDDDGNWQCAEIEADERSEGCGESAEDGGDSDEPADYSGERGDGRKNDTAPRLGRA